MGLVKDVPDQIVACINAAWTSQGLEDWGKENKCCELKKCRLLLSTLTSSPLVTQSQTSAEESSVPSPPVKRSKTSKESIVPTFTSIDKFLQNSGRKTHH